MENERANVGPPQPGTPLDGIIGFRSSRHCGVLASGREWRCFLRGKLKTAGVEPVAGDRVRFRVIGPDEGNIEEVLPRRNALSRQIGERNRVRQHVYCANVELAVIVTATQAPAFRPALIDRLLVAAGSENLTPIVCLNKVDLEPEGDAVACMDLYRAAGYEVFLTSALTGEGTAALGERLKGAIGAVWGHSGVGKTSLLSHLCPGFTGKVRSVSKRARGRHSTTEVYLVSLPEGGYVIDTPGFREFTVWGVAPQDIGSYYPEFLPYAGSCKYNNCLHLEEPGCAVREAVAEGLVPELRYRTYLRLLETHEGS